jgi:hypothetical protein
VTRSRKTQSGQWRETPPSVKLTKPPGCAGFERTKFKFEKPGDAAHHHRYEMREYRQLPNAGDEQLILWCCIHRAPDGEKSAAGGETHYHAGRELIWPALHRLTRLCACRAQCACRG